MDIVNAEGEVDHEMEWSDFPSMLEDDGDLGGASALEAKKDKLEPFPEIASTNLTDRTQKYKEACLTRKKNLKAAERRVAEDNVAEDAKWFVCNWKS